jgi:TP901 family phage tail tape measure protein
MVGGMGRVLGLGVVLSMTNRLSGPAATASMSMGVLTKQTEKSILAQNRYETALKASSVALVGAAGFAAAMGFTVSEAASFEMGMARVSAVLSPTANQFDRLSQAALQAGVSTQWTPKQAAEGLKELATAGFTAEEAHKILIPVLDLATGSLGELGVAGAAETAASAIRGFGFEAGEASRVVDVLLKSTQLTNIQTRDLRIMLADVAGNANVAGQSLEHTVAVLGALRNTGQEASVSATTLRSALRAMTTPKAIRELERLNLSAWDSTGNFRDFADIMFDLEKVLGKATEKERQLAIQAIFGQRGLNAYSAVVTMGVEKFKALENSLKTAGGSAAYFRQKMLDPLMGRISLFIGAIQTLAVQLGRPLLAPLKILVSTFWKITRFIIWITSTFPLITKLSVLIGASLITIIGLTSALVFLSSVLGILNLKYGLIIKAKWAYFLISSLLFGIEGMNRKQILLSAVAEQLKITQTDLINAKTKYRIFLERLLGIGISTNTSITYASVAAAWQERIARLGNNIALGINNALRWISNKLTWSNTTATIANAKATIYSSWAFRAASAAGGIFIGILKGIKVAMMANPILLLATVILGAVIAFYSLAKAFWKAEGASKALFGFLMYAVAPGLAIIVFAIKAIVSAWEQNVAGIQDTFIIMKNAIKSIFSPIGKLFKAFDAGSGKLNNLFKSIMGFFFMPLKRGFEGIARAATVAGAVIEIVVQEIERVIDPLKPAIDELSKAFDELLISVFGPGRANLSFWKRFGEITRLIVRSTLIPMVNVMTVLAKLASYLAKNLQTAYGIFSKLAPVAVMGPIGAKVAEQPFLAKALRAGLGPLGAFLGLQKGGITRKGNPVNATIGERNPEVIQPLPSGMKPTDLKMIYDLAKSSVSRGRAKIIIENRIFLDGQEIIRFQKEAEELEELRGYSFGAA